MSSWENSNRVVGGPNGLAGWARLVQGIPDSHSGGLQVRFGVVIDFCITISS
jgi:hypothetical protein